MMEAIHTGGYVNTQTVAEMTLEELKGLIQQVVNEALQKNRSESNNQANDKQSIEEILQAIEAHRWTPPPGAPSAVELLRADRDR